MSKHDHWCRTKASVVGRRQMHVASWRLLLFEGSVPSTFISGATDECPRGIALVLLPSSSPTCLDSSAREQFPSTETSACHVSRFGYKSRKVSEWHDNKLPTLACSCMFTLEDANLALCTDSTLACASMQSIWPIFDEFQRLLFGDPGGLFLLRSSLRSPLAGKFGENIARAPSNSRPAQLGPFICLKIG